MKMMVMMMMMMMMVMMMMMMLMMMIMKTKKMMMMMMMTIKKETNHDQFFHLPEPDLQSLFAARLRYAFCLCCDINYVLFMGQQVSVPCHSC